jgi:hypothetical protein
MQKLIKLQKPYFSKTLHGDTIKQVLISPYQTAYRLYIIVNEILSSQEFIEFTHDDYYITATVKTVAVPIGEARRQIWSIMHLQPILQKKPRYIVKCIVTHKQSNKDVYKFKLETLKEQEVYNAIEQCLSDVESILSN